MKKITQDMLTENPNVEAFVIFDGSFNAFYLSINKGAPIEKRIKAIFKPDGYAWAEDIAYDCNVVVIPQTKKSHDAFIKYLVSDPLWLRNLRCFKVQVLPYERSNLAEIKGGLYFDSRDEDGPRWKYSFFSFGTNFYYDDYSVTLRAIEEELSNYITATMRCTLLACSHLKEDQEEDVRRMFAILLDIHRGRYGLNISSILE
jgi:hypothetical protein